MTTHAVTYCSSRRDRSRGARAPSYIHTYSLIGRQRHRQQFINHGIPLRQEQYALQFSHRNY